MNPLADYRAFEAYLNSFTNYERKRQFRYDSQTVPLERMRSFVEELGSPHRAFPSVHITGSKGKGSTTLILEALVRASGFAVGTYTSPHVEELRERIRCRGESISESDLVRITNEILP
ncbi:MAG TPA: bifunctional folylpolyglutamate synthase/dihydrofolate synthase, partial [Planctomycetota bacterium]|nr:bifunctional folylpolyglutamate synthase/dihydrofolate synthase [Planctomycetota bacterium]